MTSVEDGRVIRIWPYGRIERMETSSRQIAAAVRMADQGPPALTVVAGPNDAGPDGMEACDPPTLLLLLAVGTLYKQGMNVPPSPDRIRVPR